MLSVTNYTEEVSTPDTYFLFIKSTAFMNVTFYLLVFQLTLLSIAYYFAVLYSVQYIVNSMNLSANYFCYSIHIPPMNLLSIALNFDTV